ncbi:MAG: hypothetical protein ABIH34_04905 [Nanoarchaeota archaeon]
MRADELIYWIVRIILVVSVVFGVGLFINMYRAKFIETYQTAQEIALASIPPLLSETQTDSMGINYLTINIATFVPERLDELSIPSQMGILIELVDGQGSTLGDPIYINRYYYDKYLPLTWAKQFEKRIIEVPVRVIDGPSQETGRLIITGVFTV